MPTQPDDSEITASGLSVRMERRLAVDEARVAKRTRIRKSQCVMPECEAEVHRANEFPLCINHLLLIWKHVDSGETVSEWSKWNGTWLDRVDTSHVVTEEEVEARRLAARQRQREIATTPGHLYVLDTANNTVKIGWTKRDLYQRLDEYPPHFRLIVSVPGSRADERDVHKSLKIFRAAKHEWYNVEAEVVRQINTWISLKNTMAIQSANDSKRKYGHANPPGIFEPQLLPKFTSLAEWNLDGRAESSLTFKPRPAPKSRSLANRVG